MNSDPGSSGAFSETLNQVLALTVLLNDDMERELTARGLTKSRAHVLWEVAQQPKAHQRHLSDAVGVAPRTMTGLIDGLESSGFVVRRPAPGDRRASQIELTVLGRDTADWLITSHAVLADQLFGPMRPERYDCFAAGLDEVLDRVRALIAARADT